MEAFVLNQTYVTASQDMKEIAVNMVYCRNYLKSQHIALILDTIYYEVSESHFLFLFSNL